MEKIKEFCNSLNVRELMQCVAYAKSIINERRTDLVALNTPKLEANVEMLLNGSHPHFIEADYYAEARAYVNDIPGVKNIRLCNGNICVKVVSPKGCMLPKQVVVDGKTYEVVVYKSEHYTETVDY